MDIFKKKPIFHIAIVCLCVAAVYYDNELNFAPYQVWRVLLLLLGVSFVFQYVCSKFLSVSASALVVSIFLVGIAFPYEFPTVQKLLLASTLFFLVVFYKFDIKLGDKVVVIANLFTTLFLIVLIWHIGRIEYDLKAIREWVKDNSEDRLIVGNKNFKISSMKHYDHFIKLVGKVEDIPLQNKPNIYHFVLDAYAGDKVLKDIYGHDNSNFSNELRDLGFYVSENAKSTYNQTIYSMSSVFNKSNITEEGGYSDFQKLKNHQDILGYFIGFGKVHMELKNNGYGFSRAISEYRNIIYPPIYSTYKEPKVHVKFNSFEYEFLKRKFYWEKLNTLVTDIVSTEAELNRVFIETSMSDPIPDSQPPFFYYQHNIAPHHIFNVSADGKFIKKPEKTKNLDKYKTGYINKLKLTNSLILKKIKTILESDNHSKIIIIHGDHGADPMEHSRKNICLYDRYSPYFAIYYDGRKDIDKYFSSFTLPEMYPRIFQMINNEPMKPSNSGVYYFVDYVDKSIPPSTVDNITSLDNCVVSDGSSAPGASADKH